MNDARYGLEMSTNVQGMLKKCHRRILSDDFVFVT